MGKSGAASLAVQWRLETWFPEIGPELQAKFKIYNDELQKQNKALNLIGVKTIPLTDLIHFGDSILASRIVMKYHPEIKEIYDFGSGNGFPGLIFAALFPNVKVNIVDADDKKIDFMKKISSLLGLKNVQFMVIMIDKLPEKSVQYAMTRGLGPVSKSILMTRRIFKQGGLFFHFKGEEWASEVAGIPTQLCSFWQPSLLADYKLPVGEVKFAVVKTIKTQD